MNPDMLNLPASKATLPSQIRDHSDKPEHQPRAENEASLLPREVSDRLQSSWTNIQAGFVDEPRRAIREADELVTNAIKEIAETFARERANLESQWDREGDVSTEDLRVTLTKYRSFFHRLVCI